MVKKIINPESDDSSKPEVEYFHADISWRKISTSTKRTFLVFAEQALKTGSQGLEFEVTSDGKAHIALIIENRSVPIIAISSGIFDRYWEFLSVALKSPNGLKIKKGDDIFSFTGGPQELLGGRRLKLRISAPVKKDDFLDVKEKAKNNEEGKK